MNSLTITSVVFGAAPALQAMDSDQGMTLTELLHNIPHDASAFVVYAMLLGSAALIWLAGRSTPKGP